MMGFNLSEWALKNRSITVYLMIIAVLAGLASYFRLGRAEDPTFIIKTMIVQAAWPGATVEDTLKQVTERLERKLQETPHLDFLRSFTRAGVTTIFVNLKGSTTAKQVPDIWYQVRKSIGDIRGTRCRPASSVRASTTISATPSASSTASPPTASRIASCATMSRRSAPNCCMSPTSRRSRSSARRTSASSSSSRTRISPISASIARTLIAALQAQNVVQPAGAVQTEFETLQLRVSGAFQSEEDMRNINFVVGGRVLRLSDIANVRRGYADPPQPMFRVNGEPAIGLAIAMRDGGDILALGKNLTKTMTRSSADLPLGIEPKLVADQAVTVESAISEFMTSLWQAVAIILVVSFISLGVRPGLVIATAIPLTLAVVFSMMEIANIDMQRISLGALIIALALMVDDAMTTTDAMLTRLAQGDSKEQAATFAFRTYAFAMLAGTLVTIAGFVPVGFAASSAGEYTFSLFAVVAIALVVSWFVAVIFAPLLGLAILKPPTPGKSSEPGFVFRTYKAFLTGAIRVRWLTIALTIGMFVASFLAMPLIPRQFFPSSDRPELLVDLSLPQNASIYASEEIAKRFDAALKDDQDVDALEHLCRARRHPLLSAAQRAIAQQLLRPGGARGEGRAGARPAEGEAGKAAGRRIPERGGARLSARTRAAGRLAGAVSHQRPRHLQGAGIFAANSANWSRRTRKPSTSTSTGWSRRGSCASASIRTRRGCWA